MTKDFDDNLIQKIVVPATENDFDKDYLTPTYEYYDDEFHVGRWLGPAVGVGSALTYKY